MPQVTAMPVTLRTHREEDYPAMADVYNATGPADSMKSSAEDLRSMDQALDKKFRARRCVAEVDGKIVGVSRVIIPPGGYHPQKWMMNGGVLPEYRNQGIGSMLLDDIIAAIAPSDPIALRASGPEDSPETLQFLQKRSFQEENRFWESHLDVAKFDQAAYEQALANLTGQGLRIRTLADLKMEQGYERKLYELIIHIQADMPMPEPFVPYSFEDYMKFEYARPNIIPNAYFIAVDGDRLVGVNILMADPQDKDHLNTDDTGVHRDYRRRGIALALKLHGIAWARDHGYSTIRTTNESTNQRMLKINERLGFVKRPAWIAFVRKFKDD
jgi:ribosomal protein S18 acetylase RimI-like enzyme